MIPAYFYIQTQFVYETTTFQKDYSQKKFHGSLHIPTGVLQWCKA